MKYDKKYVILCLSIRKGTRYMKKEEKELDQISTTDKLRAMKVLKEAGLKVEMSGSGVPTVVCASASDISKEVKNVRKVLKELRYNGSFGVRGPRKSDLCQVADTADSNQDASDGANDETTDEAVPA